MEKNVLIVLMGAVLVFSGIQAIAQESIRMASGEWAPYFSKKLNHSGVISHIITEAFESEGVRVQYTFFPWKRSFELTKQGKYNATPGWYKTPEREQWFYFSKDALFNSQIVFFI